MTDTWDPTQYDKFEREREEFCAATLTRLRAAIRDPASCPAADE